MNDELADSVLIDLNLDPFQSATSYNVLAQLDSDSDQRRYINALQKMCKRKGYEFHQFDFDVKGHHGSDYIVDETLCDAIVKLNAIGNDYGDNLGTNLLIFIITYGMNYDNLVLSECNSLVYALNEANNEAQIGRASCRERVYAPV